MRDVVFEEGQPHHTSAGVREETEPVFDVQSPPADHVSATDNNHAPATDDNHIPHSVQSSSTNHVPDNNHASHTNHIDHDQHDISEPRQSSQVTQLSKASLQSAKYQKQELDGKVRVLELSQLEQYKYLNLNNKLDYHYLEQYKSR